MNRDSPLASSNSEAQGLKGLKARETPLFGESWWPKTWLEVSADGSGKRVSTYIISSSSELVGQINAILLESVSKSL